MSKTLVETADPRKNIIIKGARVHNLKNIDVVIPKNKFVVITGLSGSGKSSLAFDTLYAEGQRRYVESLSSYARQFLGRMNKPDVDYIKGIAPAIAIEQKVTATNPRSTVGTSTEVYDYLKLLYARIGRTMSPVSGKEVKRDTVSSVTDFILSRNNGDTIYVFAPLHPHHERSLKEELAVLMQKGFKRVKYKGSISRIEELIEDKSVKNTDLKKSNVLQVLVDRIVLEKEDASEIRSRPPSSKARATAPLCWKTSRKNLPGFISAIVSKPMAFVSKSPAYTSSALTIPSEPVRYAKVTAR
jgi:excinuclease ABC subunit A